ncbi:efflux RND transporter periplasmic adaptor subunit [Flavobacterium gawalongense]|uniref:Efflux RND transporter periplasmic adaptor subunit n=2 Tax=Flavobacterium gawalongense TaxID=2594432 RepID=A0A553BB04_9FLAO|nr:efflux RND transporter periplasmic adaptor subunit [Flavobacterium gawalongense]TRX05432.1 efflux RND transporter periplasmic adaptor subunit [Flavobacterium gawalongense]TRX05920.1 efflux RND transporter periplasmic adaptor subunit [Flavobacterium gawalongense]TRX06232.1 efflux RND transporter periplasmic adaptor subunit [Flavobacterium gawalongense]TRX21927.1 efflux RND transporter periplasmic adaptor subunit [Flavobacterium gawalongense]
MSKRILLFTALSIFLFSCSNKENNTDTDTLIASKNLASIKAKRAELQTQITKLDEAIASLDTKVEEALVSVTTVKDTVFSHYLEVQGNVETKENLIIYPQFSGILTSLNVVAGQKVSKGQLLGMIDDGGLSQQLAQAQSQLALAKTTFERQKRLWDQKIGSEIQFLQAQTNMVSQQKMVSQIKAQLAKTRIVAPFSGVIDETLIERGQVVAPGQGLMRIVNLNNMYVSTSVPENYIGKLKVGTSVDVYLTSLDKNYSGKIRQVANNINPNNRTFTIEVSVPNKENLLRPNQVAKLRIVDYTAKNAIVVPTNVVQEDGGKNKFVFIVTNTKGTTGIAKKVLVELGQSSNNVTEILSGLSADDIIVTEGVNTISDGMKLNF